MATGQLAGYLAVLRDCRVRLGRKDLEVYGVTTDGINFQFFCLTAVGSLLISPQVSAMDEGGYNNIFLLLGAVIFKSLKQSLLLGASFQDGNTGDPVVHVAEEHFDDDRNTIDG